MLLYLLGHQTGYGLDVTHRIFGTGIGNCLLPVLFKVISELVQEVARESIASANSLAAGITRLTWLEGNEPTILRRPLTLLL